MIVLQKIERRARGLYVRRMRSMLDYVLPRRFGPFTELQPLTAFDGYTLYKGQGRLGAYFFLRGESFGPYAWHTMDESAGVASAFFAGSLAGIDLFNGFTFLACELTQTSPGSRGPVHIVRHCFSDDAWFIIEVEAAQGKATYCGPYNLVQLEEQVLGPLPV